MRHDECRGATARSSLGALWVTGLGAFLLVASAATFVAVRWDEITAGAKLTALVVITVACMIVGRVLRPTLPMTALALFHLGVLLVPVDVAAFGILAGWSWQTALLAEGASATVVFVAAERIEPSLVLRVAAWGAVVILAAGVGATTVVPAGLILAVVSLAAALAPGRRLQVPALGWAVVVGLATPLSGAEQMNLPGAGIFVELGLAGEGPTLASGIAGVVAGATLGLLAQRRSNVGAALAGIASGLAGVAVAVASFQPDTDPQPPSEADSFAAVAALVLLAELAARVWRAEPFWSQPTAMVANLGQVIAGIMTVGLFWIVLAAPFELTREPMAAVGALLVAKTWIAAADRADPSSMVRAMGPVAAVVAATAAAALATGSSQVGAVVLAVLGVVVVVAGPVLASGWPHSGLVAALLIAWPPVGARGDPAVAAALALLGAIAVASAVVVWTRWYPPEQVGPLARRLRWLALVPILAGVLVLWNADHLAIGLGGAVAALWIVAALVDLGPPDPLRWRRHHWPVPFSGRVTLPEIERLAVLVPLAWTPALGDPQTALVAGLVAVLALVDTLRLDRPVLLVGTGCAVPYVVTALAHGAGLTTAQAGLAITLTGVAWLALAWGLAERWALPALVSAVVAAGAGFGITGDDEVVQGWNLLIVGLGVAAVALHLNRWPLAGIGVLLALWGFWLHLTLLDVTVKELYVLPVAGLMLLVGWDVRRRQPVSSWLAYVPGVALLGGVALVERLGDGPGWHSVVAGGVGIAAVIAGAAWRLAGPMLAGTALVVVTTIHETLDVTARIPTWAWLGIGGAVLLTTGVVMERRDTGPVDTGRRVVDAMRTSFT